MCRESEGPFGSADFSICQVRFLNPGTVASVEVEDRCYNGGVDAVLRVVFGCLGGLLFLVVGAGMMWLMVDYCKNPKETIWTRVCLAPFGFAVAIGALLVSAKAFAQAFGSDIDLAWLIFWVKTSS